MSANLKEIKMSDETRLALLEHTITHINDSLIKIDKRFDKIDSRFDKIEERFTQVEKNISSLRSELNDEFKDVREDMRNGFTALRQEMSGQMKWILGVTITLFSGIYATIIGQVVAKVFHLM